MNDDALLMVINMRSFEYTVQKRISICILNPIKNKVKFGCQKDKTLKKCLFKALN